jgi:hypothetical protein
MQFKIKFITEQKIHAIKAVRTMAAEYGIDNLKGLREAKDGVEEGIIVQDTNLLMTIRLIDTFFKRQVDGMDPSFNLTFGVEVVKSTSQPVIVPFNSNLQQF